MYIEIIDHEIGQISILTHVVLGIESGGSTHLEAFRQGKSIVMYGELDAIHQRFCLGLGLFQ